MIPNETLKVLLYQERLVLDRIRPALLQEHPIEECLCDICSPPLILGYHHIRPQLHAALDDIRKTDGEFALQTYLKLVLALALDTTVDRFQRQPVSENSRPLYQQWFADILRQLSSAGDDYYNLENDAFLKDLGVCTLRAIPVGGAWIVERSAISRRFLVTGGFSQLVKGLAFCMFCTRGFSPFYEIHTVERYITGFKPDERERCYHRVAELLHAHPEMKGLCAGSWFYDPALRRISPRLSYLIDQPMEHGAKVFRVGTEPSDVNLALKKSETRRKLYEAGKYMPTRHLIIWPRKNLLQWAATHQDVTC